MIGAGATIHTEHGLFMYVKERRKAAADTTPAAEEAVLAS